MSTQRILVITNETVDTAVLQEVIHARSCNAETVEVFVVAPALNSRLRHWTSDEDDARRAAGLRLGACLERLGAAGIRANGWVGDADPLQAIDDGLHFFAAEEIVVATRTEEHSHWLTRNLVARARARHAIPIHHVSPRRRTSSKDQTPSRV